MGKNDEMAWLNDAPPAPDTSLSDGGCAQECKYS